MKDSARYAKIVEWSEEDRIGRTHPLRLARLATGDRCSG